MIRARRDPLLAVLLVRSRACESPRWRAHFPTGRGESGGRPIRPGARLVKPGVDFRFRPFCLSALSRMQASRMQSVSDGVGHDFAQIEGGAKTSRGENQPFAMLAAAVSLSWPRARARILFGVVVKHEGFPAKDAWAFALGGVIPSSSNCSSRAGGQRGAL